MLEKRIVLKNCELIDPGQIATCLDRDGFRAWQKAQNEMTPEQIIEEVKSSGLRGRGGAGFPAGLKWELARKAPGDEKYVICNADEGEVGTFKDRYILENDPFTLIEGIAIAAHAVGAKRGYIYLRAEYHRLLALLMNAIGQAREKGFLQHVDIGIREGAGAYVCGEESALMESIEGKRGEVRYRPPFPPTKGLWQKPTIINNVETLMNIPQIILNGARWFNQIGTERSKGTKVFSVSGDVKKPGVYEMVLGSQLGELVTDLAQAEKVKMVQVGGATGRIIPGAMTDTPLSFETVLGAGAITVFDESRDIIDIVYRTLEFLAEESCGKCTPCREGTETMVEILERFSKDEGTERDIRLLEGLSEAMTLSAMCGLGQAAPVPVLDSLQYFRADYESRIKQKQGGTVR
ncbi:NADH-quinone oxidoreductase subunit F [Chloroflexota bacterium]